MAGISDEKYEELRRILERQNGKSYSLEEAKEIGDGLVDFFNLLRELENEADYAATTRFIEKLCFEALRNRP